ncbi:MAG: hypothetical protein QOC78_4119 [Solirubrobacteraceae bacterium]|jgi:hypothetical protein|nr:hypothetical protein [Solirubrobacteraceae bacterium]
MVAAPDDDARTTLATLEAKLLELERELLQGRQAAAEDPPAVAAAPAAPAAPAVPAAAPPAPPAVDREALREARAQIAALRATLAELGTAAERLRAEARAVQAPPAPASGEPPILEIRFVLPPERAD